MLWIQAQVLEWADEEVWGLGLDGCRGMALCEPGTGAG